MKEVSNFIHMKIIVRVFSDVPEESYFGAKHMEKFKFFNWDIFPSKEVNNLDFALLVFDQEGSSSLHKEWRKKNDMKSSWL